MKVQTLRDYLFPFGMGRITFLVKKETVVLLLKSVKVKHGDPGKRGSMFCQRKSNCIESRSNDNVNQTFIHI